MIYRLSCWKGRIWKIASLDWQMRSDSWRSSLSTPTIYIYMYIDRSSRSRNSSVLLLYIFIDESYLIEQLVNVEYSQALHVSFSTWFHISFFFFFWKEIFSFIIIILYHTQRNRRRYSKLYWTLVSAFHCSLGCTHVIHYYAR